MNHRLEYNGSYRENTYWMWQFEIFENFNLTGVEILKHIMKIQIANQTKPKEY